jgi:hypothetical protein
MLSDVRFDVQGKYWAILFLWLKEELPVIRGFSRKYAVKNILIITIEISKDNYKEIIS